VSTLACRIRGVERAAGVQGIYVEHERSVDGSDRAVNISGNPANAARTYRDTDSGSGYERHAEIRRGGADHHGERSRLLNFDDDPAQPRTAGFADSSEDRGRTALQGSLRQRTRSRPRRCGIGIHGTIAAVLEDRVSAGGLGIFERTQAHDGSGRRETTDARSRRDTCSECSRGFRYTA